MSDELPDCIAVEPECEMIAHEGGAAAIFECSDDAVGCDVEEWYPDLDYGYYILDIEYREVLDHTPDLTEARAYVVGYEKGRGRSDHVPLIHRKHEGQL